MGFVIRCLYALVWISLIASLLLSTLGVQPETIAGGYWLLLLATVFAVLAYSLSGIPKPESKPTLFDLANLIDLAANRPIH